MIKEHSDNFKTTWNKKTIDWYWSGKYWYASVKIKGKLFSGSGKTRDDAFVDMRADIKAEVCAEHAQCEV